MVRDAIELLENPVQRAAWGSRTILANLLGRPSPSPEPEAELWIGAHPQAPSRLVAGGQPLDRVIARDPEALLGRPVLDAWGPILPLMMKVLAVEAPLSLQLHPDAEQARCGFEREERAGLPRNDPGRFFRDPHPKVELLCALTRFELLAGFRRPEDILLRLEDLRIRRALLEAAGSAARRGLRSLVSWAMSLPPDVVAEIASAAQRRCGEPGAGDGLEWVGRLAAAYPGDPGSLAPLWLGWMELEPGEAVFIPSRIPHSYLRGTGVEIMTNSDNVLRMGLTRKALDVTQALAAACYDSDARRPIEPAPVASGWTHYLSPGSGFRLQRAALRASATSECRVGGGLPALLLVTEGRLRVRSRSGAAVDLEAGRSAFVPACAGSFDVSGEGVLYLAVPVPPDRDQPIAGPAR